MRSNGFAVTGQELQAMVNDKLLLIKSGQSIPNTNRCLTGKEINDRVWVYAGPSGTPAGENYLPLYNYFDNDLQLNVVAPSPNWLPKFEEINAVRAKSIQFEMNQEGNPYLNCDLFAYKNGSPLRLDPTNNLDGMFFGGPQYSPEMNSSVKVGNLVSVTANFGLNYPEGAPTNYGWNANGVGILETYINGALSQRLTTGYKAAVFGPNLQQISTSFTVGYDTNYYVKAYSLVTNEIDACHDPTSRVNACGCVWYSQF